MTMVTLVTGASSGIGREVAREMGFADDLIVTARREDRLEQVARQVEQDCRVIPADLSNDEDLARLVREAGSVDTVFNVAGANWRPLDGPAIHGNVHEMMWVNAWAPYEIILGTGPDRIGFVGSEAVRNRDAWNPFYTATKFFVTGLGRAMAEHVESVGIVHPSRVRTEMGVDEPFREKYEPGEALEPAGVASKLVDAVMRPGHTEVEMYD